MQRPGCNGTREEWEIPDFTRTLARIFKESGEQHGEKHVAVWIDQLSIPQDDEQTRKTLAKILSIYKTLDVAALSPGGRYGCIDDGEMDYRGMQLSVPMLSDFARISIASGLARSCCTARAYGIMRTSTEKLSCVKLLKMMNPSPPIATSCHACVELA